MVHRFIFIELSDSQFCGENGQKSEAGRETLIGMPMIVRGKRALLSTCSQTHKNLGNSGRRSADANPTLRGKTAESVNFVECTVPRVRKLLGRVIDIEQDGVEKPFGIRRVETLSRSGNPEEIA